MGLFDIFKRNHSDNIEHISLKRLIPKINEQKIDTVIVSTNAQCKKCKPFNRKIYSVYGWNKKYSKLPDFPKSRYCPNCEHCIGITMYFDGISTIPKR